jgi:hypothetical protein
MGSYSEKLERNQSTACNIGLNENVADQSGMFRGRRNLNEIQGGSTVPKFYPRLEERVDDGTDGPIPQPNSETAITGRQRREIVRQQTDPDQKIRPKDDRHHYIGENLDQASCDDHIGYSLWQLQQGRCSYHIGHAAAGVDKQG